MTVLPDWTNSRIRHEEFVHFVDAKLTLTLNLLETLIYFKDYRHQLVQQGEARIVI